MWSAPEPGGAPAVADFRALARSSPYLWASVRLVRSSLPQDRDPVRAWIRRPQALRVKHADGELIQAELGDTRPSSVRWMMAVDPKTGEPAPDVAIWEEQPPRYWTDPLAEQPVLDERGLVLRRAPSAEYDDPMYLDYRWVAMLDPLELASGVAVLDLAEVDHHGRRAWEAVVEPVDGYEPRCECCPLLPSAQADALDAEALQEPPGPAPPGGYAEAHRVRLDVVTGICVLAEELGGGSSGEGFEIVVEEVDQDYADDLFRQTRGRFSRRRRRRGR